MRGAKSYMITNTKSKDELNIEIQETLNELNIFQNLYNTKIQILSACLQNINNEIQKNMKKDEIDFFMFLLSKSKNSLDFLRKQKNLITESSNLLESIQNELNNSQNEASTSKIEQFNKLYKDCKTNYYNHSNDAESLILDYINSSVLVAQPLQEYVNFQDTNIFKETLTEPESKTIIESQNNNTTNESLTNNNVSTSTITTKIEYPINENEDNTTLLISEVQNKVVLPYKISELKNTLKHNDNYTNIQELVNDKYIFPLTNFKNSSASRFKEGFSLMRKKEKASLFNSLDLAFEVSFNNSLNPAIIAACKNLDELDTYLNCLESNDLDRFDCFKIKYEMLPTEIN